MGECEKSYSPIFVSYVKTGVAMTVQTENQNTQAPGIRERLAKYSAYLQVAPLTVVLFIFAFVPILIILMYSVYEFNGFITLPAFVFANYWDIFTDWTSLLNLWHTTRIFGIIKRKRC